jgi:hypothetical protein
MFILLYPHKQLKQTKQNLLTGGVVFATAAACAVIRELFIFQEPRFGWLLAALSIVIVGMLAIAAGSDRIHFREAFFSMTPRRISYRQTLTGRKYTLPWSQIAGVQLTDEKAIFELKDGKEVPFLFSLVTDIQLARHIMASIRLAALEQNIRVNGALVHPNEAVAH